MKIPGREPLQTKILESEVKIKRIKIYGKTVIARKFRKMVFRLQMKNSEIQIAIFRRRAYSIQRFCRIEYAVITVLSCVMNSFKLIILSCVSNQKKS